MREFSMEFLRLRPAARARHQLLAGLKLKLAWSKDVNKDVNVAI